MEIKSYMLGKKAGGGSTINNQDKTITSDGTYTADEGYTGIGTATVQTNASAYKQQAVAWGNGYNPVAYYLDGNWGEYTPHTYTYEELQVLAPQANQTITEGITDVQTAKGTLAQVIQQIYQGKGVVPNPVPNLNGDKIYKFVTALLSQINQLESKSTTITTNGTTTITPTSGKYGISSVTVTTNVSGGDDYFTGYLTPGSSYDIDLSTKVSGITKMIKSVPNNLTLNGNSATYMFYGCRELTSVPLFNTSNVTDMSNMFYECNKLTSVPLFDTSNVTNMYAMFYRSGLTSVPQFNTSKVTNMGAMLSGCTGLTSVPLFDISNVTTANQMLLNTRITTVPQFNTSKVTNASQMFQNCSLLEDVPVLDFSSVSNGNLNYMFYGCPNLTDASLDNILQSLISAIKYTSSKTLSHIGLSSSNYPASRIQALPHYQDFLDAGWTIGY